MCPDSQSPRFEPSLVNGCGEVVSLANHRGDTGINDIPVGVRKLREVSAAGDRGSSRKADCDATLPEELRPRQHDALAGRVLERASVARQVGRGRSADAHESSMRQMTPKAGMGNTSVVDANSVVASIRALVPSTARRRRSNSYRGTVTPMSRSTLHLRLRRRLSRTGLWRLQLSPTWDPLGERGT